MKGLRRVAPMPHEDRVAYQSANTQHEEAEALWVQKKYAAAQPLYEKVLETRRRLLTDDHPLTALSVMNLGVNLTDQGKYAAAQPLLGKALAIRRRLLTDDHPDTAQSYISVAYHLNVQGQVASAQPLYEKALEINYRLLTDDDPRTANSYNNLAYNLWTQGMYGAAQPLFEKALAIRRRFLGEVHSRTATSYNNLASNLAKQGKYAAAQPLFEKALEIDRRLFAEDSPNTAFGYRNLAWNLTYQGKHAAAQPLYEKALDIRRRFFTDEHPSTADGYYTLAVNLAHQGKYVEAQPLHEKGLEIRRRLLPDDHALTAISYSSLAYNLNAQGRYLEARDRWLSAAKIQDVARLRVAFSGLGRTGVEQSVRPALAAVLARLGQPAEAWQALEEDLGRGLLDELAARKDSRLTPVERDRLRELTAALERLDRLVETTPKGLGEAERAKRFAELSRQRELASIALGEFQAGLVQAYGPRAGEVARLSEIQAALPADTALVAWVDIKPAGPNSADPDGEHWGVVVRSGGIPDWVAIKGTGPNGLWIEDDTALAGRVRTELRRRSGAGSADLRSLVERLRTQRLDPLAKALGATALGRPTARRLIVLPSQAMAGIPVEALLADDDSRAVSYAPSATIFQYLRKQPRPDRHAGLLALGDPVYAPQQESRAGEENFAPLPGTRYEVEVLNKLFETDDRPNRVLLGSEASEPELDRIAASGELGRFGFIHVATHGVIDEDMPSRSAVILTQIGLPDPLEQALANKPVFDGRLSVHEIQRSWDLKAELVTLSACETALGRDLGGEGFVGFTQALLMSGARSVCLSLWKVDDTATALLMQRFYANMLGRRSGLSAPLPKSEALREAKIWLRGLRRSEVLALTAEISRGVERGKGAKARPPGELASAVPSGGDNDPPYASPHFWAAFVLAGDPD
jgi:CHAT domain-containing protein/tetratricopeptide (TPR) repeat protein